MAGLGWGDDIDEELQNMEEFHVKFLLSFKSMLIAINKICDEKRDWDDKHPRDDFRKIWCGAMIMELLFWAFSYNILLIATLPFIGFYTFVLIRLGQAYKTFEYKRGLYVLMTVATLLAIIFGTYFVRSVILKM
jgi:hypothetical protein